MILKRTLLSAWALRCEIEPCAVAKEIAQEIALDLFVRLHFWELVTQRAGADITGADFTDALVDNYQRLQMCRRAKGTNPTTGVATRESLFC